MSARKGQGHTDGMLKHSTGLQHMCTLNECKSTCVADLAGLIGVKGERVLVQCSFLCVGVN